MKNLKEKIILILIIIISFTLGYRHLIYADEMYDAITNEKNFYISKDGGLYPLIDSYNKDEKSEFLLGKNSIFLNENLSIKAQYSLTDDIKVNVYNQGNTEYCWIYSTNSVIETTLAKEKSLEKTFDVLYTANESTKTFNRTSVEGGLPNIALSFYTSGKGPLTNKTNKVDTQIGSYEIISTVYKDTDSYGNRVYKTNEKTYTNEQMQSIRSGIKKHIVEHGAVTSCMYVDSEGKFFNKSLDGISYCYNNNTNYSNTKYQPNHQITIIGWDDNYAKENFAENNRPKNNGAYIVLNSWGEEFSKKGIFYVSYEDAFVESYVYGVSDIDEVDYENIYQYDETGIANSIVLNGDMEYGANVFTRENIKPELLTEVSVCNQFDTAYEIYVNPKTDDLNFKNLIKVATTDTLESGFHTIKIDKEVILTGKKFAVVIKYKNNSEKNQSQYFGVEYTFVKEYSTEGLKSPYSKATINAGESFIYDNKINTWVDICTIKANTKSTVLLQTCNLCIKAFTEEYKDKIAPTIKDITLSTSEWTNDKVIVTVSGASDNYCSTSELKYSFDGGKSWQTSPIREFIENTDNFEVWVKDTSDNIYKHTKKLSILNIDKKNPNLTIKETKDKSSIFSKISITCGDDESGIKLLTINGKDCTNQLKNGVLDYIVTANGEYEVIASDNAGNKSTNKLAINSVTFAISSEKFKIDKNGYIENITAGIKGEEIINNIKVNAGTISIDDANNEVKTGMKLHVKENNIEVTSYILVVTGDCTGDGKINSVDLLSTLKHYKYEQTNGTNGKSLFGEYLKAVKFSNYEKYTAVDLLEELKLYKEKN